MEWMIRNCEFTASGTVSCEVKSDGDWAPFHATPNDQEQYGRDIFEMCIRMLGYDGTANE